VSAAGRAGDVAEGAAPDARALAGRVVAGMLAADAFTRWLGAEVVETAPRRSVLRMAVRDEMVNGFGTCHGGVTYALADSAFAFACNTHGRVSVALDVSVSYPTPARPGDVLTAVARRGRRAAGRLLPRDRDEPARRAWWCLFRGTAYDTGRVHDAAGAGVARRRPAPGPHRAGRTA
jgi:acyl-CoA thioesterase